MTLINVTFYLSGGQEKAKVVLALLEEIKSERPFNLILVDIDKDPILKDHFQSTTPMVRIGPYTLREEITRQSIEVALAAAADRISRLKDIDEAGYLRKVSRGKKILVSERIAFWMSSHYLLLFNLILALYVGLAFMAPAFMKIGFEPGARVLYTIYSPLCHQFAFRSWFLFGTQAYYPRELAGVSDVISYEKIAHLPFNIDEKTDAFILDARAFVGDESSGYKVALCERDVAMYGSILLFGLIFAVSKRKAKPVPWYLWLILGLIPIAIDGLSQLPGLFPGMPDFLPNRESNPFFRTVTGGLFGFFTAWYLYPFIEQNMRETKALLTSKKIVISQLGGDSS